MTYPGQEPLLPTTTEPTPASAEVVMAPVPAAPPVNLTAAADAAAFVASIFAADEAADSSAAEQPEQPAPQPETQAAPIAQSVPQEAGKTLLAGQRVLVLGLGASGLAMARWCVRCGAQVTVADTRANPPQLAALGAELPGAEFVAGVFAASLVAPDTQLVLRSPGLSPAEIAPVLIAATARQISVRGELDLYSQALQALRQDYAYAPAVLAITGTNGKTTVTSLTRLLVECAGKSVVLAGNIGPTLLDTLTERLQAQQLPDVWVLELSSFQLDGVQGFEPTAATVLNITQDHLDWHGSLPAYAGAKARIFGQHGLMLLNREDAQVMAMLPPPVKVKLQKPQLRAHTTFGTDLPQRPGDYGMQSVNGMLWLVRALEADETVKRQRLHEEPLHIQRLMPADALRIRGRHNASNALAALALAQAAGCALAPLLYGLREYRGEPHRVELVASIQGVDFVDDSKGTNVGATVAALNGLGQSQRLVLILGGDGKGQDFAPLAAPLAMYARAAVLMGRDAPQLRAALQDAGVPLLDAADLPQAVQLAAQQAQAGDAVLLSPACASLDMFDNYGHRAQVFCAAVQELAQDAGQDLLGGYA